MIKLNTDMSIEYDGKGSTSIQELLSELGKQMNPNDKKEGHAATRDAWHELGIHALEFLKYCPFDCHYNLDAESQR